ncbi:MAG: MerR family transcriptional regulator [Clostridiales bacterium]|nr:MerR family transcriptional regulator [Clostridiales bacterium]
MNNETIGFTVGQMAKLLGINRRTLHYYDEIGLFSPSHKGENGYRYYTREQMLDLEFILAFREIGMSIEETKEAICCDSTTVSAILADKIAEIDTKIKHLQNMKRLLQEKQKMADISKNVALNQIEQIYCKEEYFFLSSPIKGPEIEDYYAAMGELLSWERRARLFNLNYGFMLSCEKIMAGRFEEYDYIYMKSNAAKGGKFFQKPAGMYFRMATKGSWDKLPQAYEILKNYAIEHDKTLVGFAYERGLNETLTTNNNEYVTEILIRYE